MARIEQSSAFRVRVQLNAPHMQRHLCGEQARVFSRHGVDKHEEEPRARLGKHGIAVEVARDVLRGVYVKGFVFGIDASLWCDSEAWAASFIRAQDDVGAHVDASLQADIASVFALVVTFCRAFCNTFSITFCITFVFSKGVRR